jgi:hypothetical protein
MTAGEARWGRYKTIYTVDISEKNFQIKVDLPCKGDAFEFHAVADVTCSVANPIAMVERKIRDIREVLKPQILETMRRISRRYEVEQSAEAETQIAEEVRAESVNYDPALTINSFVVELHLEDKAREHIQSITEIQREHDRRLAQIKLDKVREEKEAELQRQRNQLEAELEQQRSKFEMEQMQTRMDFYGPLIQGGQWNLLAMQLAKHPEDIESVARTLREQQRAEMSNQLEALRMLLEEDVIEAFQMEEASKRVLRRFVNSFGSQLGSGALTMEGKAEALTMEEDTGNDSKVVNGDSKADETGAEEAE